MEESPELQTQSVAFVKKPHMKHLQFLARCLVHNSLSTLWQEATSLHISLLDPLHGHQDVLTSPVLKVMSIFLFVFSMTYPMTN